jgi:hypothetical protein
MWKNITMFNFVNPMDVFLYNETPIVWETKPFSYKECLNMTLKIFLF